MSTPTFVILGDVIFEDMEIPESVNFGGAQSLSIKQLVGGERIIDVMGRIDDDISWSGMFYGPEALARAQYLDFVRVQGQQLQFTYSLQNYIVVVRSFSAQFERPYQIPFTISLAVVQNLNIPLIPFAPIDFTQVMNDLILQADVLAEANAAVEAPGFESVSAAIAALEVGIVAIPSFENATSQQLQVLTPLIRDAILAVDAAIVLLEENIKLSRQTNDVIASDLNAIANLNLLSNILIEMQKNLTLINTGVSAQVITVTNANLFQLAAQYYGDATEWTTIANANNLVDTMTPQGVTMPLIIPSVPIPSGGILTV